MEIDKGYIIITARIHPGESVSSYVTNGIIEFLLSNVDEHWNIWACDIAKLTGRKSADNITPDHSLQPYYTPSTS